jgi:hypothetical protein
VAWGQIAPDYVISTTTNSADWVPLSSPVVLNSGTAVSGSIGYTVALPSPFSIGGTAYNNIQLLDRGWLSFYNTTPLGVLSSLPLSSLSVTVPAVAPFGANLTYFDATTQIGYKLVGSEFVVEWLNMSDNSSFVGKISFQARLNLTNNTIKYVYGGTIARSSTSTFSAQIGIRPSSTNSPVIFTDVINLTNNTTFCNWGDAQPGTTTTSSLPYTTNAANASVIPVTGLTYTFTPQTGTTQSPVTAFGTPNVNSTGAGVSWSVPTVTPVTYTLRYRATPTSTGTCSNAWTTVTGLTSPNAVITGLTASTAYQYQVQAVGSSNTSRWSQIATFTTVAVH